LGKGTQEKHEEENPLLAKKVREETPIAVRDMINWSEKISGGGEQMKRALLPLDPSVLVVVGKSFWCGEAHLLALLLL
jgi:hypothetical protein